MLRILSCLPTLTILAALPAVGKAADTAAGLAFFETKIRPVLAKRCYSCHSQQAASNNKLKGGLQLDTRDAIRRGGESGPAVVPGKVAESLLLAAIRYESFKMPPDRRLPDNVVADFVKWIETGAQDPRDAVSKPLAADKVDIAAGRQHWAFQPLRSLAPPDVRDTAWVENAIDRFVLARQEAAGVAPNQPAGRRTLARRLAFDLVGLPPEPVDVEAFVADSSPEAYELLVDRLLASDHFGERWARHWLDLVRFAQSNGYAFDKDRPNAFHYRDFVIKAFNADMPYDEFLRLQLAGDLLRTNDFEATSATGFLVAGPFTTQQTQKERERSRYEQLDDIVATLGTSLLGLTVGCASLSQSQIRPPATARLLSAGLDVFSGRICRRRHRPRSVDLPAGQGQVRQSTRAACGGADEGRIRAIAWASEPVDCHASGRADSSQARKLARGGPIHCRQLRQGICPSLRPEKKGGSQVDLAATFNDGKLKWTEQKSWADGKVHNTLSGDNAANYLFREIETKDLPALALSLGSDDAIKVWVNGKQVLAKKVARGAAADQEKLSVPLRPGRNTLLMKIVNGGGPSGFYFQAQAGGPPENVAKLLEMPEKSWDAKQRGAVTAWFKTRDETWLKLNAAVVEHKKQEPKPNLTMTYAAKVRGTTYNFGADTFKVYFLSRGNADRKQGEADPGFLQVLMTAPEADQHWLAPATSTATERQAGGRPKTVSRRAGRLAHRSRTGRRRSGRARDCEPALAAPLWPRHCRLA